MTALAQHLQTSTCFTFSVGSVIDSKGRLIPHHFPITHQQDMFVLDENWRITCRNTIGEAATFYSPNGTLQSEGVIQTNSGPLVALICTENPVNIATLQNKDVYCGVVKPKHFYFYFISSNSSESFSLIRSDAYKITQSIVIIMSHLQSTLSVLYTVNHY